ncbi:MAG: 16S rRNA (uracil(1498)-N(3))-methyltransferase [Myxococcota bacterium]|nr:16S rRNA (uracil(1498)-N(3))-methyltransferase [Deltaproteobacteria bacterium]MDQ3333938.1 16S rRNA (uracil(1498)-N(3))-methyltransferase [Myxococcota bacterium]
MNLLLVAPNEVEGDRIVVDGRRATHLREVLGVAVGSRVRAGIVGGGVGSAEVVELADSITLRLEITGPASEPLPVEVLLAVPRPKVLTRAIEAMASFAVERITLTNAWRVDKSYLSSPRLEPDAMAHAARLGAEQGVTTHVPKLLVYRRLMELLDTRFATPGAGLRLIAHPTGTPLEQVMGSETPITVAIGPEGGWIQRELDTFVARGFTPVSLGAPILRVETAIAALLGQISMLRRVSER